MFSRESPKGIKPMENSQRLSPEGRVKPQANGGRKIRLLINKDEQLVYARLEREWLLVWAK